MIIKKINNKDFFGRDIIYVFVNEIEKFDLTKITITAKYFTLFISNTLSLDIDIFFNKAKELLKAGLVYMCAWGNECEKIHDLFDDANVILEVDEEIKPLIEGNVVMTTWHENDTLQDAIEFFLMNTSPTEQFYDECKTSIVLQVGHSSEIDKMINYLEDQNWLVK